MIVTQIINFDVSSVSDDIITNTDRADLLAKLPKHTSVIHGDTVDCTCLVGFVNYRGKSYDAGDTIPVMANDLSDLLRREYITMDDPTITLSTSPLHAVECCATIFISSTKAKDLEVTWTTEDGSTYSSHLINDYTTTFHSILQQVHVSEEATGQLVLTIEVID